MRRSWERQTKSFVTWVRNASALDFCFSSKKARQTATPTTAHTVTVHVTFCSDQTEQCCWKFICMIAVGYRLFIGIVRLYLKGFRVVEPLVWFLNLENHGDRLFPEGTREVRHLEPLLGDGERRRSEVHFLHTETTGGFRSVAPRETHMTNNLWKPDR